jgi:hypothetical protein
MRVILQRQSEVADILRLVQRLHHRTHDQRFDERAALGVAQARRDGRQVARLDRVGQLQLDAKHTQRSAQLVELFLIRRGVNAKQCRLALGAQLLRHRDIGQHHAFFDQLVGIVTRYEFDGTHPLGVLDHELGFRRVELQRAALASRGHQRVIDVHQRQQRFEHRA